MLAATLRTAANATLGSSPGATRMRQALGSTGPEAGRGRPADSASLLEQPHVLGEHDAALVAVVDAPRTSTASPERRQAAAVLNGSGNTVTSTVPSMSSSVKKAIRLPPLVEVSLRPAA
jgi:hypothetical protein